MLVLLTSALAAFLLAGGIVLLLGKRFPARWSCPRCHHATHRLSLGLLRPLAPWMERRWCSRCHWTAVGRRREWMTPPPERPEPEPPPLPRYSFRWRRRRRQEEGMPGFEWAPDSTLEGGGRGFRWKEELGGDEREPS